MKNVFNVQTIQEFKSRISQLNENSQAQWGKMNVFQMLKHCTENEKMMIGEKTLKRLFIGRIFGKIALRGNIRDWEPLKQNSPTHPDLIITDQGNVESQKKLWMDILDQYPQTSSTVYENFIHPFFGKMSQEQINIFAYKHIDHHLRQFGV